MAGLAVLSSHGTRERKAAIAAGAIGVIVAVAVAPGIGIIAGGLLGPLVAFAIEPGADAVTSPAPGADS